MNLNRTFACLLAAICTFCVAQSAQAAPSQEFNKKMGLGVNLGNCLEATNEGDWGLRIEPEYLKPVANSKSIAALKHLPTL